MSSCGSPAGAAVSLASRPHCPDTVASVPDTHHESTPVSESMFPTAVADQAHGACGQLERSTPGTPPGSPGSTLKVGAGAVDAVGVAVAFTNLKVSTSITL